MRNKCNIYKSICNSTIIIQWRTQCLLFICISLSLLSRVPPAHLICKQECGKRKYIGQICFAKMILANSNLHHSERQSFVIQTSQLNEAFDTTKVLTDPQWYQTWAMQKIKRILKTSAFMLICILSLSGSVTSVSPSSVVTVNRNNRNYQGYCTHWHLIKFKYLSLQTFFPSIRMPHQTSLTILHWCMCLMSLFH